MTQVTKRCMECLKSFKLEDTENVHIIFCDTCREHRCKFCQIVLSNKYICNCGERHDKYRKGSPLCADCVSKGRTMKDVENIKNKFPYHVSDEES